MEFHTTQLTEQRFVLYFLLYFTFVLLRT